jgi:hypothetical protein
MIPDWPDRVPDSIEPLVGYRAWLFTNVRGASLLPIGGGPLTKTAWEGANHGWVSAACPFGGRERLGYPPESSLNRPPHVIPGEDCSCGFYAMKVLSCAQQLTMELRCGPDLTLGRVELAGKVIEHRLGYRAARARIAALIPIRGNERTAKRLAESLGLPLDPAILRWSSPEGLPPAA